VGLGPAGGRRWRCFRCSASPSCRRWTRATSSCRWKLPSISLEQSAATDLALQQRILKAVPEVEPSWRVGSDELGLDPMGSTRPTPSWCSSRASWRFASKEALIDAIREAAEGVPGMNLSFTQPIEMRTSEMLSGVRGDLAIKVFGPRRKLARLATQIVQVVQAVPGSEDVITARTRACSTCAVNIDRAAVGRLGLNVEQVQNDLRALVEGQRAGVVMQDTAACRC
jgi:cobalt-zinc-cadmium resistance protein CzcA